MLGEFDEIEGSLSRITLPRLDIRSFLSLKVALCAKTAANGQLNGHTKGAPALESRTEGRLVSPTTAAEKKNCTPTRIWL